MRSLQVACLVLMDAEGGILSVQRPEGKSLGGLWEFPGGKIEEGETAEEALRREIKEELSLDLGDLSPMTPVTHAYDFGVITLHPFLSRCGSRPDLLLTEHQAMTWGRLSDCQKLAWAPADLPILEELKEL